MKIYAYLRVSTDQQAESGAGLAAQKDACIKWAKSKSLNIDTIFADEGVSGSLELDKRPALLEAISILNKGDVLLIAKRDRLGRDPIVCAMIERALERKKARLVSASGDVSDSNDPSAVLMKRMIDAFSEYERLIIGARTKAALQAKKKRNERVGYVPFGFQISQDGIHIEENQQEQSILQQIKELMEKGLSTRKIANEMNRRGAFNRGGAKWNHASIHQITMKIAA